MAQTLMLDQLALQLAGATSASDARAVVNCLSRIAGVPDNPALNAFEPLKVCQALTAEGGVIQQMAESIATSALELRLPRPVYSSSSRKIASFAASPHEKGAAAKRIADRLSSSSTGRLCMNSATRSVTPPSS